MGVEDASFEEELAEQISEDTQMTIIIEVKIIEPCLATVDCGSGQGYWFTEDADNSDGCTCVCAEGWAGENCDEEVIEVVSFEPTLQPTVSKESSSTDNMVLIIAAACGGPYFYCLLELLPGFSARNLIGKKPTKLKLTFNSY